MTRSASRSTGSGPSRATSTSSREPRRATCTSATSRPGVDVGAKAAKYLVVVTYPYKNAFDALENVANGKEIAGSGRRNRAGQRIVTAQRACRVPERGLPGGDLRSLAGTLARGRALGRGASRPLTDPRGPQLGALEERQPDERENPEHEQQRVVRVRLVPEHRPSWRPGGTSTPTRLGAIITGFAGCAVDGRRPARVVRRLEQDDGAAVRLAPSP